MASKKKVAAGIEITRDAAERFAKIRLAKKVIDRVKVCGDQIHGTRQAETPNVLLQQADRSTGADLLCYAKHVRRTVNSKHGDAPTLAQIAGKQSRATADVRG